MDKVTYQDFIDFGLYDEAIEVPRDFEDRLYQIEDFNLLDIINPCEYPKMYVFYHGCSKITDQEYLELDQEMDPDIDFELLDYQNMFIVSDKDYMNIAQNTIDECLFVLEPYNLNIWIPHVGIGHSFSDINIECTTDKIVDIKSKKEEYLRSLL